MSEDVQEFDPQFNSYLLGHTEAEQLFLKCWQNKTLHNSWLISGAKGIGKATFAFKIARFMLSA
ncbi:MAG: DNA polymerase III subunit delta', partial [Alphaproteobacteria bacterium]|nr:DNA polymerase III subunit delta' [Alphaproteobacteria bacterium]